MLMFVIDNITLVGVGGICHFISASNSLSEVSFLSEEGNTMSVSEERMAATMDRLLAAVAMNGKIETLELNGPFTAHSLANCLASLGATLQKLDFSVYGTSFSEATVEDDAEMLASAIRSLLLLEKLDFHCEELLFAMLFLNQLGGAGGPPLKLKHFHLKTCDANGNNANNIPEPLAQAIRQTLVSAPLLRSFHLSPGLNENHPSEANLDIVLSGIEQHPSIRDVAYCAATTITDDGVARIANLLLPNRNIQSLGIHCNTLMGVCTILEAIAAAEHPLRQLEVSGKNFLTEQFKEGLQRIGELLPQIKDLEKLSLTHDLVDFDQLPAPIPHQLLRGFKLNTSLQVVEMNCLLSKDKDTARAIDFCTVRNKFSPHLADASKAEMLAIFRDDLFGSQGFYESELSVVFETLRVRDDWFDKIDGSPTRPTKK